MFMLKALGEENTQDNFELMNSISKGRSLLFFEKKIFA